MSKLNHKIAVVTGGSRGIGRAIAKRLGSEGATVAVHYASNRDGAEETVQEIRRGGGTAFALGADLGSVQGIRSFYAALIFGRWGEPADIADIAAFLASPDSRWITGQVIDASGGSHL